MSNQGILVTSHVGRDILQSAQLFRTLEAAIWEYVVNSLEYVDLNRPGSDGGSGYWIPTMSWSAWWAASNAASNSAGGTSSR